jgi:hypothetical protein
MAKQSMVERVAKALLADKHPDLPWEDASELCRNDYLGHARAAIGAMRLECDPFCPIIEAVQTEVDIWPEDTPRPAPNFVQFISREEAVAIWNAGIDAALKDG